MLKKIISLNPNTEALKEAGKEIFRYLIFAFISLAITKFADWVSYFGLSAELQAQTVLFGTLLLRFIDKALHEKWKLEGAKFEEKVFTGLTPF